MKIAVFTFILFTTACYAHSQDRIKLETSIKEDVVIKDSKRKREFKIMKDPLLSIVSYSRKNEYFVIKDTLHRDYILTGTKKLVLDSVLGLQQRDYTVCYDLIEVFSIKSDNESYLIIEGGDTFPIGTNQQVEFILMKLVGNEWQVVASYENEHDMPTDDVGFFSSDGNVELRGKFLKKNTRKSVF